MTFRFVRAAVLVVALPGLLCGCMTVAPADRGPVPTQAPVADVPSVAPLLLDVDRTADTTALSFVSASPAPAPSVAPSVAPAVVPPRDAAPEEVRPPARVRAAPPRKPRRTTPRTAPRRTVPQRSVPAARPPAYQPDLCAQGHRSGLSPEVVRACKGVFGG
ncbi:hypothetical protein ABZ721_10820 [Streptomyces sp. NPDC006733]|uniref:hypothetical protein n=1 Tax=Streptomyces sp. NPDC006733 TaxID=3155460 RepID=UPI0033EA89AB